MHEVFCLPLFFHARFGSLWRGGKILLQLLVLQRMFQAPFFATFFTIDT